MLRSKRLSFLRVSVATCLVAAVMLPSARAQMFAQNADRTVPTSATLPESNEAMLLSSRVEEALQRGDHRLALELIEQILALPTALVAAPASRTFYPVWRHAFRLYGQLSAEGVQTYRQLRDAEIGTRFAQATASGDVGVLAELFRTTRISERWPQISAALVSILLERGAYAAATEVLRESAAGVPASFERDCQLVIALAGLSAWRSAEAQLERAAGHARDERSAARLRALREWLLALRRSQASAADESEPILHPALWTQPLEPLSASSGSAPTGVDAAIDALRRLPLHRGVVCDETLVLRVGEMLYAFDALTLVPRWQTKELDAADEPLRDLELAAKVALLQAEQRGGREISLETRTLLTHDLRHALTAGAGTVLTIESVTVPIEDGGGMGQAMRGLERVFANELVARELRTGTQRWRTAEDVSNPLLGVAFQDAPLLLGERLIALYQRRDELLLGELDLASGRLLKEVSIIGAPTHFTALGGRCLLACDETAIFVSTGNGVVAALSRDDLSWKWATVYPSTLAEHVGRLWWQPEVPPLESGVDRPFVMDDLLIVAPIDTQDVIALDRFSGRERWRWSRGVSYYVVGAGPRGVIVGGDALSCIDSSDGATLIWKSVALDVVGRPIVHDRMVYVPTRFGIVALDAVNGKVVRDGAAPSQTPTVGPLLSGAEVVGENLLFAGGCLFGITPRRVARYPDPAATRAACAALQERGETAAAALGLAWLDVLESNHQRAFERLSNLTQTDPALAAARDRLLSAVFVSLARGGGDPGERLGWLREASKLQNTPEAGVRVELLIGAALEEAQRWDEALAHYLRLCSDVRASALIETEAGLRCAAWVLAAQRARAVRPQVPDADWNAALQATVQTLRSARDDQRSAAALRLLAACQGLGRTRPITDFLLFELKLPAEIAVQVLPSDAELDTYEPAARQALLLKRWELSAGLGHTQQALRDAQAWHAARGDSAGLDAGARERVEQLELVMRKLQQFSAPPLEREFTRQWRILDADLVLDERLPQQSGQVALLRYFEERQLTLVNLINGGPLRVTVDTMSSGVDGEAAKAAGAALALGARRADNGAERNAWPLAQRGAIAVVPTPGGLVALGLGPERGGGQRLWETAIREWPHVPIDARERIAFGAHGVYLAAREGFLDALSWFDGRALWQLELGGAAVVSIAAVGDDLVLINADRELLVVDARSGARPRRLPAEFGTPARIDLVGETLVIGGEDFTAGLDPADFSKRWSRATPNIMQTRPVPESNAYAIQEQSGAWLVLDAGSGAMLAEALSAQLQPPVTLEALGRRDDQLIAAFRAEETEQDGGVLALVAVGGEQRWTQHLTRVARVNVTQLTAHPDLIPMLVTSREAAAGEEAMALAIRYVNRSDGALSEATPIGRHFRKRAALCDLRLHVTEQRLIVQAFAHLVAFGSAAASEEQPK